MTDYPICFRTDCGRLTDENCWHNRRGLPICDPCHDMHYVCCDYCETSVYPEFYEPELSRCNSCVEDSDYSRCPMCNDWERIEWGNDYCNYCIENSDEHLGSEHGLDGLVVEYHNGARWLDRDCPEAGNYFRGSAGESFWRTVSAARIDPNVYYGVEFEFEDANYDMRPAIERIMDAELGHLETDGSLDDGLELISRPATMEAWRGRFGYEFATCRAGIIEAGGTFDSNTVGQHIHVSRSAFSGGGLSHLARLAIFVQHAANTEYIFQLSGKTRYNFDKYSHCKKYAPSQYWRGRTRSEFRRALVEKLDDRSRAVNLTKSGSVELRFWAGTNSEADLHGSLEWTQAIIEYLADLTRFADIEAGGLLCQSFNTWLLDQEDRFPLAVRLVLSRVKVGMLA